jgi:hypothetical protein
MAFCSREFLRPYPAINRKRSNFYLSLSVTFLVVAASAFARVPPPPDQTTELIFADFNNQTLFNNFSGDIGTFANGPATIRTSFDTHACHGTNGAALRIDYSVPTSFCGLWMSLVGKEAYLNQRLNFTNLYEGQRNSTRNPSRVEGIRVLYFKFWARGDRDGEFNHTVKVEFKGTHGMVDSKTFTIPNDTNWTRYEFPIVEIGAGDLSQMKEVLFVIEDWRNDRRTSHFYLDDLTLTTDEPPFDFRTLSNDAMLDLIEQRTFGYFWRFTDDLGFALDRSTFSDEVSVAATGFQLAAYCIGHSRDWADKTELENRVVRILQNLIRLPTGPDSGTKHASHRGFYYHFLSANYGTRKDPNVELSPYDTMLLMGGVLACREYFPTNQKIQVLTRQLFNSVEWNWMVDRSPGPNSKRFYLGWKPGPTDAGTFIGHVDGQTDEALMLDIMALGSRQHPIGLETYFARNRIPGAYPNTNKNTILASWEGSLFNYFFTDCWVDLRRRGSDVHPSDARNLWENDRRAVIANWQFCVDHATNRLGGIGDFYSTYAENSWGLTACDNLVKPGGYSSSEYFVFGALPTEENIRFGTKPLHVGTIAIYGAASSINFLPEASTAALRHYFEIPGLWNPLFGFGDAFSLDPHVVEHVYDKQRNPKIHYADFLNGPWVNNMMMGVDQGPMLLAIENYRSGLIWNLMAKNEEVRRGLDKIFGPAKSVGAASAPQGTASK